MTPRDQSASRSNNWRGFASRWLDNGTYVNSKGQKVNRREKLYLKRWTKLVSNANPALAATNRPAYVRFAKSHSLVSRWPW